MTVSGNALRMRCELSQLAKRHGIAQPACEVMALSAPSSEPLYIEGIAIAADVVDSDRMAFRKFFCFSLSCTKPQLLYRHDPEQVAGEITNLDYDSKGNLRIRALVTHELARRCPAFSASVRVDRYSIRNEDTADYFACIEQGAITEISLTDRPACAAALVTRRYPTSAAVKFYDLAQRGVGKALEIVEVLQKLNGADGAAVLNAANLRPVSDAAAAGDAVCATCQSAF